MAATLHVEHRQNSARGLVRINYNLNAGGNYITTILYDMRGHNIQVKGLGFHSTIYPEKDNS